MLPISQVYAGSICEVKSMTNDFLSVGHIIKIDHGALELAAAADEFMQLLKYNLPVKLFVRNSKHADRILVGTVYLSTDNFLRVEEIRSLQDFERRGAFRVNSNNHGRMFRLMNATEQKAFNEKLEAAAPSEADELLDSTYFDVRVVDISLKGLRIVSPIKLSPREKYGIEFTPLDELMTFFVTVERIITHNDGSIQYGCSFYEIPERQIDMLCRDLFQLQRIEKNRKMNSASQI